MSWILKKIVHNEAMRTDPKEIYGWRVYALACSVSPIFPRTVMSSLMAYVGMLWRNAFWNGLGYHRWCPNDGSIQSVSHSFLLRSQYQELEFI
jgi:hypothetical protein